MGKKKRRHSEGYCKENNLLQLPLFRFRRGRTRKQTVHEWIENGIRFKLSCHCRYGVPGSFEQDTYNACMRIWVRNGMPSNGIFVTLTDIANVLMLDPRSWCTKIKKSLQKLCDARYEIENGFIKRSKKGGRNASRVLEQTWFSLFETATLYDQSSEIHLRFHQEIKDNLEAKYYQWLDFSVYKKIKTGLARRLYEFLEKKRYRSRNNSIEIGEEKLCRWLPILDKNTTNRRKTCKQSFEELVRVGYLDKYEFNRSKKRFKAFYFSPIAIPPEPNQTFQFKAVPESLQKQDSLPPATKPMSQKTTAQVEIDALINLANRQTQKNIAAIKKYYKEQGFAYVEYNILYANEKAKKNYSAYLQNSLKKDWGSEWGEAAKQKLEQQKQQEQQAEQKKLAEQQEQHKKDELRQFVQPFFEAIAQLPSDVLQGLWQQAICLDPKARAAHTKTTFCKLALDNLNQGNEQFTPEILSTFNMGDLKKIQISDSGIVVIVL